MRFASSSAEAVERQRDCMPSRPAAGEHTILRKSACIVLQGKRETTKSPDCSSVGWGGHNFSHVMSEGLAATVPAAVTIAAMDDAKKIALPSMTVS